MSTVRSQSLLVVALLVPALAALLAVFAPGGEAHPQDDLLARADRLFAEKTYKPAIAAYEKVLEAAGTAADDRAHAVRRIAESHARIRQWDEGVAVLERHAGVADSALWKARLAAARGTILLQQPHYVYEKNGEITRGRWVQGGVHRDTTDEDMKGAVTALLAAERHYVRAIDEAGAGSRDVAAEATAENARLALALEQQIARTGGFEDLVPARAALDALAESFEAPAVGFDPMAWYRHAGERSARHGDSEGAASSRYLAAMFARRVLDGVQHRGVETGDAWRLEYRTGGTDEEPLFTAVPEARDPLHLLAEIPRRFAGTEVEDEAVLAFARIAAENELYVLAVSAVASFEERFLKSLWRSDALGLLQEIRAPILAMEDPAPVLPGASARIALSTRNVARVTLTLHPIDLAAILSSRRYLADDDSGLTDVQRIVDIATRGRARLPDPIATVELPTGDQGRHRHLQNAVDLVLPSSGAYVIIAQTDGLRHETMALASRIAMVRKVSEEQTIVYVAESESGRPLQAADVLVRQRHTADGIFGRYQKVTWDFVATDADGLARRTHAPSGGRWLNLEAWAHRGDDHAFTSWSGHPAPQAVEHRTRIFALTDRPVYRPEDVVHFVGNVRQEGENGYENVENAAYTVTVSDARGNEVYNQRLTTDAFGAVEDRLTLAEEPPLGVWHIRFTRQDGTHVGHRSFRVEEYKKPEFEVEIDGPEDQVRAGGAFAATVRARYYSGGAVDGATVDWRVFRESYAPWYGRWGRPGGGDRELVAQGQDTTDAAGALVVEVSTEAAARRYPDADHRFVIEADVRDLSRRTISAATTVLVTRTAAFAHLKAERGYFRAGETARFDLATTRPDGSPLALSGVVEVHRLTTRVDDAGTVTVERSTERSIEVATGEDGAKEIELVFDEPGRRALVFTARDRWDAEVRAEVEFWVHEPGYRADEFQNRDVEIATDRPSYAPGDTAYLLITSVTPDASVFLTVEADRRILSHRVVALSGRTGVVALKLDASHAPNVFVQVMAIGRGQVFSSSTEISVPPRDRFLDVELAFDRDRYRPGQEANLRLTSRNAAGEGVPAQFAVRVMDQAITYIQQDTTGDIRDFFYGDRRTFHGDRGWGNNVSQSLAFRYQGFARASHEWKRYRNHGALPGWWPDFGLGSPMDGQGGDMWGYDSEVDQEENYEEMDTRGRLGGLLEAEAADAMAPGSAAPMERGRGESKSGGRLLDDAPMESADFGGLAEPEERSDFSDLALWAPTLRTGPDGVATVSLRFPDSLTTWVANAWGLTQDTRVGAAETRVTVTKDLLIRLQAPRFFTERDEIVLSGVVRNGLDRRVPVRALIELEGDTLELAGDPAQDVEIEPGAQRRVDWLVRVVAAGEAKVRMKALSELESDAVAMTFPVLPYGREKIVTHTAILDDDAPERRLDIELPADRRESSARLELTLSPSLAGAMLDAVPYLIDYPYGCTEQTLSRFMPAVVVAQALQEAGVSIEEIAKKRAELAADRLTRGDAAPVLTSGLLADVVASGLERLRGMQNADGGWGWWRADRSNVHLTCYALHGLTIARSAGIAGTDDMIARAASFLEGEAAHVRSLPEAAYAALALAAAGRPHAALTDRAWERRDEASAYVRAQLALALHHAGDAARARNVIKGLEDLVTVDASAGTAHWRGGDRWWFWWGDEIETNAAVLQALAAIQPDNPHTRPLALWLVRNRSGNAWKSTRDTANCVLALARYMAAAGELRPDYEIVARYGDREIARVRVDRDSMFAFDNVVVLESDALETGSRPLTVTRSGTGTLYVAARLIYFSTEEKIEAAGHGIQVARRYELVPLDAAAPREGPALADGAEVPAGREIEVILTLTVDNDYEYVMVEDRKAAGFEPVDVRSGGRWGDGLCSNMELRDEKVVFFVTWLQQGRHEIRYRIRPESPGTLHAMPTLARSMYAPALGGISDSWLVNVADTVD